MIRPLAVVALSLILVVGQAHADDVTEANKHFTLGVTLFKEKRFEAALVEFQRAYEIKAHPLVLFNIGLTYGQLLRYDEALDALDRAQASPELEPRIAERARKEREDVRARAGTIEIVTHPEGATVSLDDRPLGTTPLTRPYAVAPGVHKVHGQLPDGRVAQAAVTTAAGDKALAELTFPEPTAAPVPEPEELPQPPPPTVVLPFPRRPPRAPWLAARAAVIADAATVGDTGAPEVGVALRFGRVSVGVDVLLVAWAVVPAVRVRLFGDRLAVHAIAAAPIAIKDGDQTETFVAGAGGLGVSLDVSGRLALFGEALVSVAADPHGVTVPVTLGVRAWLD